MSRTTHKDTSAVSFAVYVVGAAALVGASFFLMPPSTGVRFLSVWTAFILLFPIGLAWKRFGTVASVVVVLGGWAILAAQAFYPLFGLSMLAISSFFLDGSAREQVSSRASRLAGTVFGVLFVSGTLVLSISQLSDIPEIHRFRALEAGDVSRIEIVVLHGDQWGQVSTVSDPQAVEALVSSFSSTFTYYPDHEAVTDYEPCRMLIHFANGRQPESLVLGSRTSASDDVVYMDFDDGRGTFHNRPLRVALVAHVPELAAW